MEDKQKINPDQTQNIVASNSTVSEGSAGPIIGIIIILAVIILGGFYFWSQRDTRGSDLEDTDTARIGDIQLKSNSDELQSIEADLNATEIDNLDAELNAS